MVTIRSLSWLGTTKKLRVVARVRGPSAKVRASVLALPLAAAACPSQSGLLRAARVAGGGGGGSRGFLVSRALALAACPWTLFHTRTAPPLRGQARSGDREVRGFNGGLSSQLRDSSLVGHYPLAILMVRADFHWSLNIQEFRLWQDTWPCESLPGMQSWSKNAACGTKYCQ